MRDMPRSRIRCARGAGRPRRHGAGGPGRRWWDRKLGSRTAKVGLAVGMKVIAWSGTYVTAARRWGCAVVKDGLRGGRCRSLHLFVDARAASSRRGSRAHEAQAYIVNTRAGPVRPDA